MAVLKKVLDNGSVLIGTTGTKPNSEKEVKNMKKLPGKYLILGRLQKGVAFENQDTQLTVCRKCWSKGMFDLAELTAFVPKWEFTLCPKDRKRYFKKCPNCKVIHRKPVRQVRCDLCGKMF